MFRVCTNEARHSKSSKVFKKKRSKKKRWSIKHNPSAGLSHRFFGRRCSTTETTRSTHINACEGEEISLPYGIGFAYRRARNTYKGQEQKNNSRLTEGLGRIMLSRVFIKIIADFFIFFVRESYRYQRSSVLANDYVDFF
jgi:hypothetical protein